MEKNLMAKQYGNEDVLHTYSAYNSSVRFEKPAAKITEDSIRRLRQQEERVYRGFSPQCNNYAKFIELFRGLFANDYTNDQEKLASFSVTKLLPMLESAREEYQRSNVLQGKEWHFTLKVENEARPKLEALQKQLNGATELKFLKEPGVWEVVSRDFSVPSIKRIFNAAFGTNFWGAATDKRQASVSKKALQRYIDKAAGETFEWIQGANSIDSLYIEYRDPLTYGAEKLRAAEYNDKDSQDVLAGMRWIKETIFYKTLLVGASSNLIQAFEQTWTDNFSENYQNISLFMKKGGETALAGGFGEFQAALITNYVLLRFRGMGPSSQAMIASSLGKTEQTKRDVTILGDFGIQVKNYDPQNGLQIATTMHPAALKQDPLFKKGSVHSIFRFLANYYFNLSYAAANGEKMNELTDQILPAYFAQIANLDLGDIFRRDVVSFYLISGRYLVPASDIAEAVYLKNLAAPITITSSYGKPQNDKGYHSGEEPEYQLYWGRIGEEWQPTDYNKTVFENLMAASISIRTSFSRALFTVDKYDLFG